MNACIMLPMPQMLSHGEYITIAKKTIRHFAPAAARRILRDEEAFDQVVQSVMEADWKWDPNRVGSKSGLKKTPYSLRNQYAKWAVLGILERYAKQPRFFELKPHHLEKPGDARHGDSPNPESETLKAEQQRTDEKLAFVALNCESLSERERAFLRLHFIDGYTNTAIARRFSISKQAVSLSIKRVLNKLQRKLWEHREA